MCISRTTGVGITGVRLCMWISLLIWPIMAEAVELGDIAPDFTLPLLANPTPAQARSADQADSRYALLKLSDYRGKVVYLDFWQSSCVACRDSLPLLSQLRDEFTRDDVEILGVNTDVNPRRALAFISDKSVAYPVVSDPAAQVAQMYGLNGLPTAYLIARDGTVREVHEGFQSEDLEKIRSGLFALSEE